MEPPCISWQHRLARLEDSGHNIAIATVAADAMFNIVHTAREPSTLTLPWRFLPFGSGLNEPFAVGGSCKHLRWIHEYR